MCPKFLTWSCLGARKPGQSVPRPRPYEGSQYPKGSPPFGTEYAWQRHGFLGHITFSVTFQGALPDPGAELVDSSPGRLLGTGQTGGAGLPEGPVSIQQSPLQLRQALPAPPPPPRPSVAGTFSVAPEVLGLSERSDHPVIEFRVNLCPQAPSLVRERAAYKGGVASRLKGTNAPKKTFFLILFF